MILDKIKAATAEKHRSLEKSPLLLPLGERRITKSQYINILIKFYGYFFPLEETINKVDPLKKYLPDFFQRRKAALILQDLRDLNYPTGVLPLCTDLPQLGNLSEVFGAIYVMEGSTLGGQFITKVVKSELDLTGRKGTAFFSGYRKETGARWKSFQNFLREFSETSGNEDTIVESAMTTFSKLEKWFNAKPERQHA